MFCGHQHVTTQCWHFQTCQRNSSQTYKWQQSDAPQFRQITQSIWTNEALGLDTFKRTGPTPNRYNRHLSLKIARGVRRKLLIQRVTMIEII